MKKRLSNSVLRVAMVACIAILPEGATAGPKSPGETAPKAVALPPQTPAPDPFERALEAVGLTRSTMRFDYADMSNYGGDEFRLPLFTTLHSNPFKTFDYLPVFRKAVEANFDTLLNLVKFCSLRLGQGVRRGDFTNPLEEIDKKLAVDSLSRSDPAKVEKKARESLLAAIAEIHAQGGKKLSGGDRRHLTREIEKLPPPLCRASALLLLSSLESLKMRGAAFLAAGKEFDMEKTAGEVFSQLTSEEETFTPEFYRFVHLVDWRYLYAGGEDLGLATAKARTMLDSIPDVPKLSFSWDTPLGWVVFHGSRNDTLTGTVPYLLVIDLGGDDFYTGGGTTFSSRNPVSILIDRRGNDVYRSEAKDRPSWGGAIMGYAFLIDEQGDDSYWGVNASEGAGLFGVGALLDLEGNDHYKAYTMSQGSGSFGIGVLADTQGDDSYDSFTTSQGFGYTLGMGLLADKQGNDQYLANDTNIDFPASQTKEHNASLSQGVGFGRRADFSDGHSLAGGIGMLLDAEGNDTYSAGLFAQGCAYWYGIGVLVDGSGVDQYKGIWYVQGSGAHFGLGILWEGGGNDHYVATMNMAQGAGHDFTLGILYDEAGNDIYDAPNLSLGGGNDNGIGMFWDKSGDDVYNVAAATTLGRANISGRGGLRDKMICLGLFVDTGGKDAYSKPFAMDNSLWTQAGLNTEKPLEAEKGVGLDRE